MGNMVSPMRRWDGRSHVATSKIEVVKNKKEEGKRCVHYSFPPLYRHYKKNKNTQSGTGWNQSPALTPSGRSQTPNMLRPTRAVQTAFSSELLCVGVAAKAVDVQPNWCSTTSWRTSDLDKVWNHEIQAIYNKRGSTPKLLGEFKGRLAVKMGSIQNNS